MSESRFQIAHNYLTRLVQAKADRRNEIKRILTENKIVFFTQGDGDCQNIIVHFGTPWERVVGAHYDAILSGGGEGANDNGAACAELLALATTLTQEGYKSNLSLVFFDQEERMVYGDTVNMGSWLLGDWLSREGIYPRFFLVLDVTGRGDRLVVSDSSDLETNENLQYQNYIVSKVAGDLDVSPIYLTTPPSDNRILGQFGIRALLLSTLPRKEVKGDRKTWSVLHSKEDNLDSIHLETLVWVTDFLYRIAQTGVTFEGWDEDVLEDEPSTVKAN